MKIQIEDEYSIVTIVDKTEGSTCSNAVGLCRRLLMALEYHPDTVASLMPDEHELDEIIADGIKAQQDEVLLDTDNERVHIQL